MRHVARGVVARSGAARPRVQWLEVGDGGVTSGICAAGSWIDPYQDGTSGQAAGVGRGVAAAGQSFPETTKERISLQTRDCYTRVNYRYNGARGARSTP